MRDEIIKNTDDLARWVKEEYRGPFVPSQDLRVIEAYRKVISSAQATPQYSPRAQSVFASAADSWIIAHALAGGYGIVAHEVSAPGSKSMIKIPDVCSRFSVPYLSLFDLMRRGKIAL